MADNSNHNSRAAFDRNADVNLSAEQLSYICKYCGKVNPMSAPNCIRCGKRRPRSEYLDAMKRLDASKDTRQTFISEQVRMEAQLRDAKEQEISRIVDARVEDEKAQLIARQTTILDQDREEIKRATARDAVLRIIAAEAAADSRVAEAEARADAAINGRRAEIDDLIAEEREKALNAAAERLVSERAAIEEAAKERIEANQKVTELEAVRQMADAQDEAERNAARHAVLRVIAIQNAAEEQIRLSRNAFQQAATERIVEERILADKEAAARYAAEKQAIEQAAEERVRAERERIRKILGDRGANFGGYYGDMQPQTVQPFAIVPYVNPNQPVMQYDPERVVYKFVPDEPFDEEQPTVEHIASAAAPAVEQKPAPAKTGKAKVCGLITAILSLAVIAITAIIGLISKEFTLLNITDGEVLSGTNTSVLLGSIAFVIAGFESLFGASIALPEIFTDGFFTSVKSLGFPAGAAISLGVLVVTGTAVVVLIRGIVRLVKGNGKKLDWIAGLVMLVGSLASAAVCLLASLLGAGLPFADAIKNALLVGYGNIALIVISVIVTVLAAIGGKGKKTE